MMKRLMAVLLAFVLLPLCCCAAATDSALPSRYDMREKGIVTPVKLQYPWGSCWSFASVAAAETSILSAMGKTYEEYPLDLSELHAAWFAKRGITAADDPVQAGDGNLRLLVRPYEDRAERERRDPVYGVGLHSLELTGKAERHFENQ